MTKKFLLLFLLLLSTSSLFAANEVSLPVSPALPVQGETAEFLISADTGEWILPKTGLVFTEGGDYSGMTLPSLAEQPEPLRFPSGTIHGEKKFVIAIEVLENGNVGQWKIMQSTGQKALDEAAVEAIRSWRFHPATKAGKSIRTCVQIPVGFQPVAGAVQPFHQIPVTLSVDFGPAHRTSVQKQIQVTEGATPKEALSKVLPIENGAVCCDAQEVKSIDGVSADPAKNLWWICKINGEKKNVSPHRTHLKRNDRVEWVYVKDNQ